MTSGRSHPCDSLSRLAAGEIDARMLQEQFEDAFCEDQAFRAGAFEWIAAAAIARVRLLERQCGREANQPPSRTDTSHRPAIPARAAGSPDARQERSARAALYRRSGNVIALPGKRAKP